MKYIVLGDQEMFCALEGVLNLRFHLRLALKESGVFQELLTHGNWVESKKLLNRNKFKRDRKWTAIEITLKQNWKQRILSSFFAKKCFVKNRYFLQHI